MKIQSALVTLFIVSTSAFAQSAGPSGLTSHIDLMKELNLTPWPVPTPRSGLPRSFFGPDLMVEKSALSADGSYDGSERANSLFDETEKNCLKSQEVEFRIALAKFGVSHDALSQAFKSVYHFRINLFDMTAIGENPYPLGNQVGSSFFESNPPLFAPYAVALLRKDSAGQVSCILASADLIFEELKKVYEP
jgi:hypothetical protein